MFHKRCESEILYLRERLDEAHGRIEELENQILVEQKRPTMAVGPAKMATVHYMDDARVMELEEGGHAPT